MLEHDTKLQRGKILPEFLHMEPHIKKVGEKISL